MKEEAKKKNKSKKKVFRRIFLISLLISLLGLGFLFFLDIVPILYFFLIAVLMLGYDLFMGVLMLSHGWKRRLVGTSLTFVKILGVGVVSFYVFHTMNFLHQINDGNYNTVNYSIIALNQSKYNKLKDLQDKKIGIVKLGDDKGLLEAKLYLNKKTSLEYVEFEDFASLEKGLAANKIDAILIEDVEKNMLREENEELITSTKVIYEFSINIEIDDGLVKNVNVSKEPFTVFLSGIDSYGKITSVSRSDVNMLITINPTTHKILLISIPRDYYVKLHGVNSKYKDKITHAGIKGIDTSIKTVEDLLSVDVNYYTKVNFTSLVNIVDELGGVDVEVEKEFKAHYVDEFETIDYSFSEGANHLNGKEALAFARERKSLPKGDLGRVEHQQILLSAILEKIISKNIIIKYNDLLKSMDGKFVTNFGTENMTKLIKEQLKEMPSWTIESYTLIGTDSHEYTYTYKTTKSYVMLPNEESINYAKEKIKAILSGE